MSEDVRLQIETIARERQWTRSQTAAWLLARALEAYEASRPVVREVRVPA